MSNISDYIIPVNYGNGVIVGDIFITASHVYDKDSSYISFNIDRDSYRFSSKDAILHLYCTDKERTDDFLFNDVSIYRLNKRYNNLSFDTSLPNVGDIIQSISLKHTVKQNSNNIDNPGIFYNRPTESYECITSKATISNIKGNFIFCNMEPALEKGRSGSPLVHNNRVVGILHAGFENEENIEDNGKLCVFQSISSIKSMLEENGIL